MLVIDDDRIRVYPQGDAARGVGYRRLTYQRITTDRVETLAGIVGPATAWLQLDCWSEVQSEAEDLAAAVQGMLDDANTAGTLGDLAIRWVRYDGDRDDFERPENASDRGVYRVSFDVRICYCEG